MTLDEGNRSIASSKESEDRRHRRGSVSATLSVEISRDGEKLWHSHMNRPPSSTFRMDGQPIFS